MAGIPVIFRDARLSDLTARHKSTERMLAYANSYVDMYQYYTEDGLYAWGAPGNGKTHTMCAILREAIRHHVWPAQFWSTADLFAALKASFDTDAENPVPAACATKLLVLDDIGKEKPTDWVAEQVFNVVNARYNARLPTLFTSNVALSDLGKRFDGWLTSRIAARCTPILKLDAPDGR